MKSQRTLPDYKTLYRSAVRSSYDSLLSGTWKYKLSLKFIIKFTSFETRNSAVCITTAYRLDDQGGRVRVPVSSGIFTSPWRPDRLWGPPILVSNTRDTKPCSPLAVNRRLGRTCLLLAFCFTLASFWVYALTLKIEETCFSEMSVDFQRIKLRFIPEDITLRMVIFS
jgi:hypothetical protein